MKAASRGASSGREGQGGGETYEEAWRAPCFPLLSVPLGFYAPQADELASCPRRLGSPFGFTFEGCVGIGPGNKRKAKRSQEQRKKTHASSRCVPSGLQSTTPDLCAATGDMGKREGRQATGNRVWWTPTGSACIHLATSVQSYLLKDWLEEIYTVSE